MEAVLQIGCRNNKERRGTRLAKRVEAVAVSSEGVLVEGGVGAFVVCYEDAKAAARAFLLCDAGMLRGQVESFPIRKQVRVRERCNVLSERGWREVRDDGEAKAKQVKRT